MFAAPASFPASPAPPPQLRDTHRKELLTGPCQGSAHPQERRRVDIDVFGRIFCPEGGGVLLMRFRTVVVKIILLLLLVGGCGGKKQW